MYIVSTKAVSVSRDSSVDIVIRYGLGSTGIESRWRRYFPQPSRQALDPPSLLYKEYRVFPGGEAAGGMVLTTHPHLAPRLMKE
jgi:hypothetical protein